MPAMPLASVIIPTRDCIAWLPGAILSIGPNPDIEIIVFNDGSTDGTREWLDEAARTDRRIVVMEGTGIGPSKARNAAIEAARAPLVAFLDADDRWYPGKLEQQIALHRRFPEASFSFTDYRHVTGDGEDRGPCFAYWPCFRALAAGKTEPFALGGDAVARIFAENVVGTSTVVARTDLVRALNGFSGDLPSSEDWDLWLRLAQRGPVLCVPQIQMDYLMHRPGNMTNHLRARALSMRMIAARHEAAVRAQSGGAIRVFATRMDEAEAEIAQRDGNHGRALLLRLRAFARSPSGRGGREFLGALKRACSHIRLAAA